MEKSLDWLHLQRIISGFIVVVNMFIHTSYCRDLCALEHVQLQINQKEFSQLLSLELN
jgi:hypothetical protein